MKNDLIVKLVWTAALVLIGFIVGALTVSELASQQGYIQAIIDHKEGKPLKYILQTNKDHTTEWVLNKEYMGE